MNDESYSSIRHRVHASSSSTPYDEKRKEIPLPPRASSNRPPSSRTGTRDLITPSHFHYCGRLPPHRHTHHLPSSYYNPDLDSLLMSQSEASSSISPSVSSRPQAAPSEAPSNQCCVCRVRQRGKGCSS